MAEARGAGLAKFGKGVLAGRKDEAEFKDAACTIRTRRPQLMTIPQEEALSATQPKPYAAYTSPGGEAMRSNGSPPSERICLIGPGWRFTSGISYYTCRLAGAAAESHDISVILLRQLLPRFLYPGKRRVGQPRARATYPSRRAKSAAASVNSRCSALSEKSMLPLTS